MWVRSLVICIGVLAAFTALSAPRENHSNAVASPIEKTRTIPCNHPRGSEDAKRIAKRAWSKPYGPTTKDRKIWKLTKDCARTFYQNETRFVNIWEHYKESLSRHRDLLRLELKCSQSPTSAVIACIKFASQIHSYPYTTLYRIAGCESGYRPSAGNPSGASGLFQFMPSTFSSIVYRMQQAGEKIRHKIMVAKWNSLAAAYKMKHDGTSEWVCQ